MAKEIPTGKRQKIGMYDSDTQKSLYVLKTVDVTEDCPGIRDEKVLLKFTKAKRGRIVNINHGAAGIHFFVDELDRQMNVAPRDDTFGSTAERLGLDKPTLRSMLEQHAPPA